MNKEGSPSGMLEIAGLAAQIILENGAETYRVEDTVLRLCGSYGYHDADVIALSTGVLISVSVPGDSAAVIRRVRNRSLNLARVNAVNALSREIALAGEHSKNASHQGISQEIPTVPMSMDDALSRLKDIAASKTLSTPRLAVLAGLSAGAVALMFGGGVLECLVAFVCGVATQAVLALLSRMKFTLVLNSLAGGLVCSLVTMAFFFMFDLSPAGVETALTGAIMPLISGLMMTNAVRDTLRGDLLSGIARGVEAVLVAVMVALGVSLLLRFYLPGEGDVTLVSPPWYLSALLAGIGTLFFCPILYVPKKAVLPASLLGAAAYCGFLLLRDGLGADGSLALLIAAAATALLCEMLARKMRMIATVFLCVALIPLVPGLALYRTMRALLLDHYESAMIQGLNTLMAVGAIALGAAIGALRRERPRL